MSCNDLIFCRSSQAFSGKEACTFSIIPRKKILTMRTSRKLRYSAAVAFVAFTKKKKKRKRLVVEGNVGERGLYVLSKHDGKLIPAQPVCWLLSPWNTLCAEPRFLRWWAVDFSVQKINFCFLVVLLVSSVLVLKSKLSKLVWKVVVMVEVNFVSFKVVLKDNYFAPFSFEPFGSSEILLFNLFC